MLPLLSPLLLFFFLVPHPSVCYVDTVQAQPLHPSFQSLAGTRAASLDANMRLLTVLTLQQNGWQLFGQHWYKLFEIDLQWIPAENFCRAMGAHLASITDAAENHFVHTIRKKNNVWIGLNKVNSSRGVYGWSDGRRAEYLNWDSTQPNEPAVHCVYMAYQQEQRGTWFDYGCHEALPQYFVCKLPTP